MFQFCCTAPKQPKNLFYRDYQGFVAPESLENRFFRDSTTKMQGFLQDVANPYSCGFLMLFAVSVSLAFTLSTLSFSMLSLWAGTLLKM